MPAQNAPLIAVPEDSAENADTRTNYAEARQCPVCGMPDPRPLCVIGDFHVLRCAQCAADFVSPAPDEAALRAYYDRADWFEGGERGGYENYDKQTVPQLPVFDAILDSFGPDGAGRSVLDVGCGYGTHLDQAHRRGWKCFGVEVSAHAREVIHTRYGHKFFIADDVKHLIPHEFDLIVLFDVLEHLADPYCLFYTLFSKGAITPNTTVIIATPNARSVSAVSDPSGWAFRHPPSHLVYFSGQALTTLLKRLHFGSIEIHGTHEETAIDAHGYPDEDFPVNDSLAQFGGLICTALGSDFAKYMQERYVPGTWSKLAEYEHLPRYLFARDLAAAKNVLDFGCGSGYGAAILAQRARTITGFDIDDSALDWAKSHHRAPNLSFQKRADLGADLPSASFDLITCFEMIEHVPEALQIEAVRNFSRLLTSDGLAIISTPNPETTKQYGANPYHIREMNRTEFETLIKEHFQHVIILEQHIQPSVFITPALIVESCPIRALAWEHATSSKSEPAVFIAVCSHSPIPILYGSCYLDFRTDFIKDQLETSKQLDHARFYQFQASEVAAIVPVLRELVTEKEDALLAKSGEIKLQAHEVHRLGEELARQANEMTTVIERQTGEIERQAGEIERQASAISGLNDYRQALERELASIKQGNWHRLGMALRENGLGLKKVLKVGYLFSACLAPQKWKLVLRPAVLRLRRFYERQTNPARNVAQQIAKPKTRLESNPPRIVHVIANFMLGGSSQLVVDLIQGLGDIYEQKVVTSHLPSPRAYDGVDVSEFRSPQSPADVLPFLSEFNPSIIHVHYWGDVDWWWYDIFFRAAQTMGCRIVENVNTPVHPYKADHVDRYVHVSNYVRHQFGDGSERNMTIYPGIDFSLFSRPENTPLVSDCIGMVYRLESDKLNQQSIDVFIKIAQKRPQTKVLIVGGGTYFDPYRQAVQIAGVAENFEFAGYVDYAKLPELYQRMSIFVAPVWKESFGQVGPFAMNLGIPLVGYDVGGLREIVNDPALLAAPGNSDELAGIIMRLLDDPARRREIGAQAYARAQALFSVDAMVRSYRNLYAEMMELKR